VKKGMIDPGHVGHDSGAVGPSGVQERDITLRVARKLADILRPVMEVRLTREDDRSRGLTLNADLQARADAANDWGADIFVSIHCNSAADRTAHGCEVWTSRGQTGADELAEAIIKALEAEFPDMTMRKDYADGDSDKEAGFAVLTRTRMPAALPELAFISNPTEEALLESPAYQDRAARAIAEGIAEFLGVQLPAPVPTDQDAVRIVVAGQVLTGKEIDDRTWAPVRPLAEALGLKVIWNDTAKTVVIE